MLCWLFRLMISDAADSNKPIGPWTHRHVMGCVSCRRFHQSCHLLAEGLQSETPRLTSAGRTNATHVRRAHPQRPIWADLAAAACIVLVALVGIALLRQRPQPAKYPFTVSAIGMNLSTAWTRMFEAPLIGEAQNLSNDTQAGIRFLVSCLDVRPFDDPAARPVDPSGPPSIQ